MGISFESNFSYSVLTVSNISLDLLVFFLSRKKFIKVIVGEKSFVKVRFHRMSKCHE